MIPSAKKLLLATGASGIKTLFSTTLYSGTGNDDRLVDNGLAMSRGSLLWIKERGGQSYGHFLSDTARGADRTFNLPQDDGEQTTTNRVKAFLSRGFRLGVSSDVNGSGSFVAWAFRKGRRFFDVVTFTGNGAQGRKVPHSLASVPGMIIVKSRGNANFVIYHRGAGATKKAYLNGSDAFTASAAHFANTTPTDAEFTLGNSPEVNALNVQYVAYVFAGDTDFIKCGSYVGDGAARLINIGLKPQFMLLLDDVAGEPNRRLLIDKKRRQGATDVPPSNPDNPNVGKLELYANKFDGENPATFIRFAPTGFEHSLSNGWNGNGRTYHYLAIGDVPS